MGNYERGQKYRLPVGLVLRGFLTGRVVYRVYGEIIPRRLWTDRNLWQPKRFLRASLDVAGA